MKRLLVLCVAAMRSWRKSRRKFREESSAQTSGFESGSATEDSARRSLDDRSGNVEGDSPIAQDPGYIDLGKSTVRVIGGDGLLLKFPFQK